MFREWDGTDLVTNFFYLDNLRNIFIIVVYLFFINEMPARNAIGFCGLQC